MYCRVVDRQEPMLIVNRELASCTTRTTNMSHGDTTGKV